MKTLMPKVDTKDGLFHNGNPVTGEQGTQVKDVWLNNVQENLRDIQAEAHYVLKKAGFNPADNKQTQLYESIVKIIGDNRKTATTKDKGEVKLNSAINSEIETEAATPKAVKAVYDKAVEAKEAANAAQTSANAAQRTANDGVSKANAAQTSANNANNNANGRVSRGGDTLTGILHSVGITSKQLGMGAYSEQYSSGAPFMVEEAGSVNRDTYHPFVKGRVRSENHYGAALSFGYTTKQGTGDGFGRGIINLIEDNGKTRIWGFEHNGEFKSAGDVITSSGKSLNTAVQLSDYRSQWGATGWVKLPNGLILQWGKTPVIHDENSKDIVFPIAFPNKVLNIQLTENQMRTVEANATHLAALNVTNTKFTFKMNSTLPIDTSADWFAIGY